MNEYFCVGGTPPGVRAVPSKNEAPFNHTVKQYIPFIAALLGGARIVHPF
jgi:hypothetical protein